MSRGLGEVGNGGGTPAIRGLSVSGMRGGGGAGEESKEEKRRRLSLMMKGGGLQR